MRWIIRLTVVAVIVGGGWYMLAMPGQSYSGALPPLNTQQQALRDRLRHHVEYLAGHVGERNVWRPAALRAAAGYIEKTFGEMGSPVELQWFEAEGIKVANVQSAHPGSEAFEEIVVIGAHYDSVLGCPGANDNATGVAAILEIARALQQVRLRRTLRFVAFVNEEPPFFQTAQMGSLVYAQHARQRNENIVAMLSVETIGYYSEVAGSQTYPLPFRWFYPNKANFIGMVGNMGSRALVREVIGAFRRDAAFPSEGVAAPEWIEGVGWSDHWAFWQQGYRALMITDTALFRYPHYHSAQDTPDKIDYDRLARVVDGLTKVALDLSGGGVS